ncbi:MAG: DUF721 domain-containing protein [bacterium]|nr:DUF721 domain-containing protein [bacterium]
MARDRGPGGRRKGRMQPVGDLVGRVLGELGLDGVALAHRIGSEWPEIVGEKVAEHCRPLGLRAGVLEVQVDSPVWSQQLQLRKAELLEKLEARYARQAPREVRFQVGYPRRR